MPVASNESERLDLKIVKGKTLRRVIRWEIEPLVAKAITGIAKGTPARVTATAHGAPDGWRVAVVGAGGMRQINAESFPPKERDFHRSTVVDANTITLDDVSSAEFTAYTSGGTLVYYTPASLAGCTALLVVRDKPGGDELVRFTDADGIELDDTNKTITITFEADASTDYDWTRGVHEFEIRDTDGVVTGLYHGTVTISQEIAT